MQTRPHLAAIYAGERTPLQLAVGDQIEFDPFSIAGGELHPASIGLEFRKESDESVVATGVIDPMFAGPPERVHGGIQALIVDEVMGALNRMLGRQAFTARLTVNYRAPAPLGLHPDRVRRRPSGRDSGQSSMPSVGDDGTAISRDGIRPAR